MRGSQGIDCPESRWWKLRNISYAFAIRASTVEYQVYLSQFLSGLIPSTASAERLLIVVSPSITVTCINAVSKSHAEMSLNTVVKNLVRAAAGIAADISDNDLDKHVAQLLAKEAKEREMKWSEIGLGGLLSSSSDRGT